MVSSSLPEPTYPDHVSHTVPAEGSTTHLESGSMTSDDSSSAGSPQVQLVGSAAGDWVTWRWAGLGNAPDVVELPSWDALQKRLRNSLPTIGARSTKALRFDGALTDRELESELMRDLGRALLPEALRRQIIAAHEKHGRISFRVAPAPSAAHIPWGLLFVDDGRRLLDVADVSWIGPLAPRDLEPQPIDKTQQAAPLYIIDPLPSQGMAGVFTTEGHGRWHRQLEGLPGEAFINSEITRRDLEALLATPRSRLVLVGHCHARGMAGDTGFQLSDGQLLTASDLVLPSLGAAAGDDSPQWLMPTRAAIVACASGTDLSDHEPFGLSTAMLSKGARTVQATLWPLPTDHAFGIRDIGPHFTQLATAIDDSLQATDPVGAFNAWQRGRLADWTNEGGLTNAPLTWAAVATIHAPNRYHQS